MADTDESERTIKALLALQDAIGLALLEAHHTIWPASADVHYTIIQRNGKAKIQFNLPATREPGYKDC